MLDVIKVIVVLVIMLLFHDFIYEDEVVADNNYVVIEMRK